MAVGCIWLHVPLINGLKQLKVKGIYEKGVRFCTKDDEKRPANLMSQTNIDQFKKAFGDSTIAPARGTGQASLICLESVA